MWVCLSAAPLVFLARHSPWLHAGGTLLSKRQQFQDLASTSSLPSGEQAVRVSEASGLVGCTGKAPSAMGRGKAQALHNPGSHVLLGFCRTPLGAAAQKQGPRTMQGHSLTLFL